MAEGLRHVNERISERSALLPSHKAIRDLADELLGVPSSTHVECTVLSQNHSEARAALLESSIGDLLLDIADPLHPNTVGNGGVVPPPLDVTRERKNLCSTDIGAVRIAHPWVRHLRSGEVDGLLDKKKVLLLPQADGTTYATWTGRVDWQSGVYVNFNWRLGKHEVQETIGLEVHENDPGALPLLHSNIGFSHVPQKDFTVWRSRVRPVEDEAEAAYMVSMIKGLYGIKTY